MEKDILQRWKNLGTLYSLFLKYAQLGARNRRFLHEHKVTDRTAMLANGANSRSQANMFSYQPNKPLNNFLATMMRCVACPLYNQYHEKGPSARMPGSSVLQNPHFERSGEPDPETRGILQPSTHLMAHLATGMYFTCKSLFRWSLQNLFCAYGVFVITLQT